MAEPAAPPAPAEPDDAGILVDAIETIVRTALAPVVARLRALETIAADVGLVRERVAVLESREPVPGPPGPPGADGLGFDDYAIEYDGERTYTHAWTRGDVRRALAPYRVPVMLYRGVYVAGKLYDRGDCVTAGGSLWHCNAETTTRPGDGSPAWTLAVKRGRDARERDRGER